MEAKLTEDLKEVDTLCVAYLVWVAISKVIWMRTFSSYLLYTKPPLGFAAWVENIKFLNFRWLQNRSHNKNDMFNYSVTEADVLL